MSNVGAESGGREYGAQRQYIQGPSTYKDERFLRMIAYAGDLLPPRSGMVCDLMCGPGKLGLQLQQLNPGLDLMFVDLSQKQLDRAHSASTNLRNQFIQADARRLSESIPAQTVDLAVIRYALKDLTVQEKVPTLEQIGKILRPQASRQFQPSLVIADMVAPNRETRDWLNKQHSMKQGFEWRDHPTEGHCYIPTLQEWFDMLKIAGFFGYEQWFTYTSSVNTKEWLSGGQIKEDQLAALNKFIFDDQETPEQVRTAFNIRTEENGDVRIDYPVTVIRAYKLT